MKSFIQRLGALVLGVLSGFDRMRFRGSKLQLCYPNGILGFLQSRNIPTGEFKAFAQRVTEEVFQAIEPPAKRAGIYRYLNSFQVAPEEVALRIAAEQGRTSGLIAVLGRVEPCQTIEFRRGKSFWTPHLKSGAKCLHYYHYYLDPIFGLRYTRMQTWFPFTMHLGLNGRDWLARQMASAGIGFAQRDNCFTAIDDVAAAQLLCNQQLTVAWPVLLQAWAEQANPLERSFLVRPVPYYWTLQEGEFATDIMFRSADDLRRLYPDWVRHSYATLKSGDLMRFFDYRLRRDGSPAHDRAEVKSKVKEYAEGTRVRHRVMGNTLKMYDKEGSVLRVETMLNDLTHFRAVRPAQEPDQTRPRCMRLRKGVADIHRRAEISQRVNERYCESLATVNDKQTLAEATDRLGRQTRWKGRTVRAINPLAADDVALLEAISRGEFLIQGFRNRDIRALLFGPADTDPQERRRQSNQVTRRLQLLRAHGLISRVPKTHSYQVASKGRTAITALLAARSADTKTLLQAA